MNEIEQSGQLDQSVNLEIPGILSKISQKVLKDIDYFCQTEYDDGFRRHLGASVIGNDCKRFLWYGFNWCFYKVHDGRQQRLFERGHREEARFIEWLKGAGFEVSNEDISKPIGPDGKYPQYQISGVDGHFGGSMDGLFKFPKEYGIPGVYLLEFKTNGTGPKFRTLKDNGLRLAKPVHFSQTSVYGYKYNLTHCLYLNICKNDDDIHSEFFKLDLEHGERLEEKAKIIIHSQTPPARLSEHPTFFTCKYCDAHDICHGGKPILKNCRSCKNRTPIANKQWFCNVYNGIIPDDFIETGCRDNYEPIA